MSEQSIGQILKARRTELGFNLSEAEARTNVQKLYIVALEMDDYSAFPGEFYVKAYLKQYAEKLGLDATDLLLAHEAGTGLTTLEKDPTSEYRFVKPSERIEEEVVQEKNWRYYLPIIILSCVAVAILVGVGAIVFLNRSNDTNFIQDNATQTSVVSSTPISTTSSSEIISSSQTKVTTTGAGTNLTVSVSNATQPVQATFQLNSTASSWISVTNSDLAATGLTLDTTTTSKTVTINKEAKTAVISIGSSQGLTLTIANQKVDLSSIPAGQPATINLEIK